MNKMDTIIIIIIILIIFAAAYIFSKNKELGIQISQYEQIKYLLSIILKLNYDYCDIKLEVQYMN